LGGSVGAGVDGAGVDGVGLDGAGVDGAGVDGVGVEGAGVGDGSVQAARRLKETKIQTIKPRSNFLFIYLPSLIFIAKTDFVETNLVKTSLKLS